jgi:hypothetical protein
VSASPLVGALVRRLEEAGYKSVSSPFRVASVEFKFTAAMRGSGPRSLDLVIIIDAATGSFGDTDGSSVRNRIEALSRALDITRSRYTLSAVIGGATLAKDVEALSETCRVLTVPAIALGDDGRPASSAEAEAMDDQIRLLLPLALPLGDDVAETGKIDAVGMLLKSLSDELDPVLVQAVVVASSQGDESVKKALGKRIDDVLGELEIGQ